MVDRLQKRQSARLCGVVIGWLRSLAAVEREVESGEPPLDQQD
jgi:hypothetical protein